MILKGQTLRNYEKQLETMTGLRV